MQDGKRFALAALAWGAMVAVGLGACGGSGGGSGGVGSGGTAADASSTGTTVSQPSTTASVPATSSPATSAVTLLGNCEMFPAQAVFNTRIDDTTRFPAHASSAQWVSSVGGTRTFHADWWKGV